MKVRGFTQAIWTTTLLALLAGCFPLPTATETASTPRPTITPRPTQTPEPTDTPRPTRTRRPTRIPGPTRTPVPTATPLPFPTLEPEETLAFIADMLATNDGCELPCWWSIVPGETSWDAMVAFFNEQGIIVAESGQPDFSYRNPEGRDVPMRFVSFRQKDGLVQSVIVEDVRRYRPLREDFTSLWQRYALQPVLARHGVPSYVYLNLTVGAPCAGAGNFPDYKMWIVYEDQGIAIRYLGLSLRDNEKWLVCPVFGQMADIEIHLQSPDADTELVDPRSEVYDPSGYFSIYGFLPELTGMSTQAFYDTFSQPEPRSCIAIPDTNPLYDEIVLPADPQVLSQDAEDALLVEMLANNGGCELPCWWGITPGTMRWEDAQQIFLSYGKSVSSWDAYEWGTGHRVGLFGRHDRYPFDYVVEHMVYEQDGVVSLIGVHGHTPGWPADEWSYSQHLAQDWERYSLDQVLARFGQPSQVLLHYWSEGISLFSVGLLYEDQGILIEYMGQTQGEKAEDEWLIDPVVICPNRSRLTDINLWLKPPEAEPPLADVFARFGGGYLGLLPFISTPSLEEATGMSLATFYQTYLDPNTEVCLEAAGNLGDVYP